MSVCGAHRLGRDVVVPAVVLAELSRGPGRIQMVDAHVVAAAAEVGGGVIITGDEDDMNRLGRSYPNPQVVPI